MNNKIMKYENNFFTRIVNKIKHLFVKKELLKEIKGEQEEIQVNPQKQNNNIEKQKFVELVRKFNAREIEEKDLTAEEIEQLTKYYEDKNKELDREIEKQKIILENIKAKLNRYQENVIGIKS